MKSNQPTVLMSGASFVQPIQLVVPRTILCSALENLCARVHHTMALFFPLRSGANIEQTYAHLKHGMGLLLYEHPILCGLLRQNERGDFNVEIPPAPRAGAPFHFSDVSMDGNFPSFNELQERGFPFVDGNIDGLKDLRPVPFPSHEDGQPAFTAKLSHVRGGLVWTCSLSHAIADMAQIRAVMIRWAKHTHAVTEANGLNLPTPKQVPYPDRERLTPHTAERLSPEEIQEASKAVPNWMLLDLSDPEKLLADIDSIFVKANVSDVSPSQRDVLMEPTSGLWRFTPSDLKIFKERVKQDSSTARLSEFDIVTSFIWQRFHLAKRGEKQESNEPRTAQIVTAFDVRRKLNPPLPATFIGACVDLVTIAVDKETLLPPPEQKWKGIADIASNFRKFRNAWSEREFMDLLSLSRQTQISPGIVPRGPFDMLVTDHAALADCVAADWGGEMGKCVALREPYIQRETPRGEIILLPKQPNGDLNIMISAEAIVLQRLLADEEMRAACENVFVRHNVLDSYKVMGLAKAKL